MKKNKKNEKLGVEINRFSHMKHQLQVFLNICREIRLEAIARGEEEKIAHRVNYFESQASQQRGNIRSGAIVPNVLPPEANVVDLTESVPNVLPPVNFQQERKQQDEEYAQLERE